MKFATVTKSLVMGLVLLLAGSAFAASKASLTLNHDTTVNGTKLKAGDYKLQWDGSGPDVEVSIVRGKNVVAKVPAKLVDLNSNAANDEVKIASAIAPKTTTNVSKSRNDGAGRRIVCTSRVPTIAPVPSPLR